MKNIATKLMKFVLVIALSFTSIFNNLTVQASETIKSLMDSNNVKKVYSTNFTVEEDAKISRDNEIKNQETIKLEKSQEGISYLYYVSKLEQFKKTVPTSKDDFKEVITEFESAKIIKTYEELKQVENDLVETYESLNDEDNIYAVTITLESNTPVKVDTKFNQQKYETLEDAVNATKETDLEIIKEYDEEDNVTITVDEACANQIECNKKVIELENNENYTNVLVTIKKFEDSTTDTIVLEDFETKTFVNNEEEATSYANSLKEAILEYIKNNTKDTELPKINFTTVNLDNLDNILSSKMETVYQMTNVSGTYKSEDAARSAAINYINELKENNSLINVEKSMENIIVNPNKVETVTVGELFEYRDDALEYFNNLSSNEYTYKNPVITAVEVSNDNNNNDGGNNNPTVTNTTWWHLDVDSTSTIILIDKDGNYIDTVEGDVLITNAVLNDEKTLSYPTDPYYDTNRRSWEFRSGDYRNLVKDGDQLKLQGTISYTYNKQTKTVPFSYTGQILSKNNLCKMPSYGYDMSISGITVDTDDNAIVEISKKYKLSYDKYNYTASINLASDKNTYTVTNPNITKNTTNISYKLDGSYEEKGYDYIVNFPEDVMEDRYSFKAEISHLSKSATKEIDSWKYYVQTLEIIDKGGDEESKEEVKEPVKLEEAPKTGNVDNYNYINLILVSLLVVIKKLVK